MSEWRSEPLAEVVLTGAGAITPRGDFTFSTLATPPQAASPQTDGPPPPYIEGFQLESYLESPKTYLDRASALALAGSALALRDAGVAWPVPDETFGITLGTHLGCLDTMKGFWDKAMERGVRVANPLLFSHSYLNSPISLCAIEYGLKGYHSTFCAGADSGLEAVRAAFDAIRLGHATAMLCGGVEANTAARATFEPGEVLSEAAVFFVLESRDHAAQREAIQQLPLDETLFQNSESQAATPIFGDCGGASGALAVALQLRERIENYAR